MTKLFELYCCSQTELPKKPLIELKLKPVHRISYQRTATRSRGLSLMSDRPFIQYEYQVTCPTLACISSLSLASLSLVITSRHYSLAGSLSVSITV